MAFNKGTGVLTGTTGAAYKVAAVYDAGVVGYRNIGGSSFRVRVEPFVDGVETDSSNFAWKQPGDNGQNRFSTVVSNEDNLIDAIIDGASALLSVPTLEERIATALAELEASFA